MKTADLASLFMAAPGQRFRLADHDPAWADSRQMRWLGKGDLKERAVTFLAARVEELARAQELLWASDTYSLLVILQAMDAAGKDGIIRHVMSGLNPQGCQVVGFKAPTPEELDHDFLWRCAKALPERGRIGIFNRSYYEEVLVVKVHPAILAGQRLPPGKRGKAFWQERYDDVNRFEHHLARNGTVIVKLFLHVSREEQKRRLLERLDTPDKHWKFSATDAAERVYWDDYMRAYEEAISATSTEWAPWYVIPADHKYVARALVADLLTHTIDSLDLRYPELTPAQDEALAAAREQLEQE